jgi:hypothetical protein
MKKIEKLNLIVNYIIKNYNIKLTDYHYIDQVIIHDSQQEFFLEINNNELQYIKSAIKMLMYKKVIMERDKTSSFSI